ncbi:hypothetical protein GCM10020358_57410 [Amorphoplanes nipponensis]|uniref:DUF3558 domain-containing protein n=1 Tax=Actinoplanes nipponensis TaxID=135950 RepID=A0A919JEL8_9ACTN|nr:DUF3558 family protein [Actinoplanes nipponensis]GIE47776.1 hypothetical protein Ani05nite_13100 [Actinoplanes nipponensis]
MNRRRLLVILAAACFALTGCGVLDQASPGAAAPAPAPTPSASAGPTSGSGLGDSVRDAGDIPDPCTLLSEARVTELTGRDVTRIDQDGQQAGDTTRFCQWQQAGGQLAVFLSRTTDSDFTSQIAGASRVDGVGEDAFQLAGHLYVLYGTVQIDVYSRGDSDEENLAQAKAVTRAVMAKI